MGSTRRIVLSIVTSAALGAALLGTAAVAQQDEVGAAPVGVAPDELLERLDVLELSLPDDVPPGLVTLEAETTWGSLDGDAGSVAAVLDTLEADLRGLFVDADEADGPVADAVAVVARGWLDVWHGTSALRTWESNDLAFPLDTSDADDVATGADELRGNAETGLELVLQGRARHLEGYTLLRTEGAARPDAQARLDARAAAAEVFHDDVRPVIVRLLSQPSTAVAVPTDRFDTNAPGVEPRATSLSVRCIDREALAEMSDTAADPDALAALEAAGVVDCPPLDDDAVEVRERR